MDIFKTDLGEITPMDNFGRDESFFRALIENSADAIALMSPEGLITYASPSTENVIGYTSEEFMGQNGFTLIHPDDLDAVQAALAPVLKTAGLSATFEYRFRQKNGEYRWLQGTATNLLHYPAVHAILGNFRDISKQKQSTDLLLASEEQARILLAREQEALRQAEVAQKHLNDLFVQAPALISILTGPEHRLALINDSFRWLYGNREFTLGKTVRENWPDLEGQGFFELLDRVYQTGVPYMGNEVLAMIDRAGTGILEPGYFNIVYQPANDARGKVSGIIVHAMEVTEQVLARQRIQNNEARLRRLIDANIVGVIFCDMEGHVNEANDVFLQMVGYTREDLQAGEIDWARMTPPEYTEVDLQALKALREKGAIPKPYEKAYYRKDGTLLSVVVTAAALDESNPNECVAFILDNSMQKELDQRKDDFISMASHELKTPVTSIKGFTQVLLKRFEKRDEPDIYRFLSIMDLQLNKLTKLIGDLLDISKAQDGKLTMEQKPFELDTLVAEIVEQMQATTATHNIKLEGKTNTTILGDRDRIGQVIVNLVTNAIKYSPRASTIVVRMLHREDQIAVVQVQDSGIGIDPIHHSKIFNQFYRVTNPDEPYPGLGIGLYLSRQIIERHAGKLWVESTKGEGSTFTFSLPIVPDVLP
ncbi:PAS domain S-box protein [Dictyobacter kobayashii]|nr:PAS domain S-box protein [Dictyobacter kobayashii]